MDAPLRTEQKLWQYKRQAVHRLLWFLTLLELSISAMSVHRAVSTPTFFSLLQAGASITSLGLICITAYCCWPRRPRKTWRAWGTLLALFNVARILVYLHLENQASPIPLLSLVAYVFLLDLFVSRRALMAITTLIAFLGLSRLVYTPNFALHALQPLTLTPRTIATISVLQILLLAILWTYNDIFHTILRQENTALQNAHQLSLKLQHERDNLELHVRRRTRTLVASNRALSIAQKRLVAQTSVLQSLGYYAAATLHNVAQPVSSLLGWQAELTTRLSPEEHQRLNATLEYLQHVIRQTRERLLVRTHGIGPVHLHRLIERIHQLCQYQAIRHNITLTANCNPSIVVAADEVTLEQALLNIVQNSFEALKNSNGTKQIRITVDATALNATIAVHDNGKGISPEEKQQLGRRFFTTKTQAGTGLGLAYILDNVTNQPHTSFTLESEPGKGTTALLRLPLYNEGA